MSGSSVSYTPQQESGQESHHDNTIEKDYSKLKAILRKLAERTVTGLIAILEACADLYKPDECENYFLITRQRQPASGVGKALERSAAR